MDKTLIIHDLSKEDFMLNIKNIGENVTVFNVNKTTGKCIGCFNCWVKTPGRCVFKDSYKDIPNLFASHKKILIISKNVYGGYSPEIKNILDRSIGYLLPFFKIINNEMHHFIRYDNKIEFIVYFYDVKSEEEGIVGEKLVKANALNLGASKYKVYINKNLESLGESINEYIIT